MVLDVLRTHASSWLIKVVFAIIILVFIFWGIGTYDSNSNNVATIDGEAITIKGFEQNVRLADEQMRRRQGANLPEGYIKTLQNAVFKSMLSDMVIENAAKSMGITVSDAEVRKFVTSMPQFLDGNGTFNATRYSDFVEARRQTPSAFEADVRQELLKSKMLEYITMAVQVTEAEARSYFDNLLEQRAIAYKLFSWEEEARNMLASIDDNKAQAFYQANQALFSTPPMVRLDYVLISPAELSAGSDPGITGQEIEEFYNNNPDQFTVKAGADLTQIYFHLPEGSTEAEAKATEEKLIQAVKNLNGGAHMGAEQKLVEEHHAITVPLGWQDYDRLPPDVAEKIKSLKIGQFAGPIAVPYGGFLLLKLNGVREAKVTPLTEAFAGIRQTLAERKASERLSVVLEETLDNLLSGMDLKSSANEAELKVKSTELLSADQLSKELGISDAKDLRMIFDTPQGLPIEQALATPDGYILAVVAESLPQRPQPFAEVKEKARLLGAEEAAKAKVHAQAVSEKDKASVEGLKESVLFGRQGQELGLTAEVAADAFRVDDIGAWLEGVYPMGKSFIIAKLVKRTPPEEQDWQREKESWLIALENREKNLFYNAYVNALLNRAEVEIYYKPLMENLQ